MMKKKIRLMSFLRFVLLNVIFLRPGNSVQKSGYTHLLTLLSFKNALTMHCKKILMLTASLCLLFIPPVWSARIIIENADKAGEGLNHPTLGIKRWAMLLEAKEYWESFLQSDVPIRVKVNFTRKECGVHGETWPENFYTMGEENVAYATPIFESKYGNVNGQNADIVMKLNNYPYDGCKFDWDYEKAKPLSENEVSLYNTIRHELVHGFGFISAVDENGAFSVTGNGNPSSFDKNIKVNINGLKNWIELSASQRKSVMSGTGKALWAGNKTSSVAKRINAAMDTTGITSQGYILMDQTGRDGSAMEHFDDSVSINDLMEPYPNRDFNTDALTKAALLDMGWNKTVNISPIISLLLNESPKNTCAGKAPTDTVVSAGGLEWMCANLGASRVATSSTDSKAYGDLYQWGRRTDGHEKLDSSTTSTLSTTDKPEHGNFIIVPLAEPQDWRIPQKNSLWQGKSGTNNPCQPGFRLPTETELETEANSWVPGNAEGAFNSPTKFIMPGYRLYHDGTIKNAGSNGRYWTSTVDSSDTRILYISSGYATWYNSLRGNGYSVRCIRDYEEVATVTSAGQVWMDRNLGASQVATSSTDEQAYGDLYQWGRGTDGHEKRDSGTTSILSTSDTPDHGNFITASFDWRNPSNDNLWQGISGINNPCPFGFRLPTSEELRIEWLSWPYQRISGAFASPLRLVAAGARSPNDGLIYHSDPSAVYWTSTVISETRGVIALYLNPVDTSWAQPWRSAGASVRCIMD